MADHKEDSPAEDICEGSDLDFLSDPEEDECVPKYADGPHSKFKCKARACFCKLVVAADDFEGLDLLAASAHMVPADRWSLLLSQDAYRSTGATNTPAAPLTLITDSVILFSLSGPVPRVLAEAVKKLKGKHNKRGQTHSVYNIKLAQKAPAPADRKRKQPAEPEPAAESSTSASSSAPAPADAAPALCRWRNENWMAEFDCAKRRVTVCTMSER